MNYEQEKIKKLKEEYFALGFFSGIFFLDVILLLIQIIK